jgi:YHS domain-containing protein
MMEEAIVDASSSYSDYNGDRYYYCCPACKKKFDANPKDYTKTAAQLIEAYNTPKETPQE